MKKLILIIMVIVLISGIFLYYFCNRTYEIKDVRDIKLVYYYIPAITDNTFQSEISSTQYETIKQYIQNWKFDNYSEKGLALDIEKGTNVKYELIINENIRILFDSLGEEFAKICYEDKEYLTNIPEGLVKYLSSIIDAQLEDKLNCFRTESITVTSTSGNKMEITDEQQLNKFLNYCKDICLIDETYEFEPIYTIDFHNGLVLMFSQYDKAILYDQNNQTSKRVAIPPEMVMLVSDNF